jgi:hypothetical protein
MEHHVTSLQTEVSLPPPVSVGLSLTFSHPDAVLAARDLTREDKRAYLAWWASDVWAVESAPALRYCPGQPGRHVPLDEILAALRRLDAEEVRSAFAQTRRPMPIAGQGSRAGTIRWLTSDPRRRGVRRPRFVRR